jgi:hypothetical protein
MEFEMKYEWLAYLLITIAANMAVIIGLGYLLHVATAIPLYVCIHGFALIYSTVIIFAYFIYIIRKGY